MSAVPFRGANGATVFMTEVPEGTALVCDRCHTPIFFTTVAIAIGVPVAASMLRAADGHDVVDGEYATCPTHGPARIHAMVNP